MCICIHTHTLRRNKNVYNLMHSFLINLSSFIVFYFVQNLSFNLILSLFILPAYLYSPPTLFFSNLLNISVSVFSELCVECVSLE